MKIKSSTGRKLVCGVWVERHEDGRITVKMTDGTEYSAEAFEATDCEELGITPHAARCIMRAVDSFIHDEQSVG